tara:strand:- start:175 stop:789 length:615 start_codon:yes stop_codon:yes gene_type:complete
MNQILFVLTAASATGKTSCIKKLCDMDEHLVQTISHSTRPKRPDEVDGVDKYFVSEEAFNRLLEQQQMVEYTTIFGHQCGHTKTSLEQIANNGNDIIMVLNYAGLCMIKKQYPNTVSIFLLPPSVDALKERIHDRPEAVGVDIKARIDNARSEMLDYKHYDYIVFNDKIDKAVADLKAIVAAERLRNSRQCARHEKTISLLMQE